MEIVKVETQSALEATVARFRRQPWLCLDTEFVPERTFHPQLCLIQLANEHELVIIDPILNQLDVSCFWNAIVEPDGPELIVHAGKEELCFCHRATGKTPERIFDIQLASAFAGLGYPQSLTSLLARILNQKTFSKEQRTDWSKRPLTQGQYNYAADDVRYLYAMTCELRKRLEASNRLAWLSEEQASLRHAAQLRQSLDPSRVAGSSRLSAKQYVVLGSLVAWRVAVAERVNRPIRTVVRDDVLVELARRQPKDLNELRLTRGLQLRQNSADERELLAALHEPHNGAQAEYPRPMRVEPESTMVVKILSAAIHDRSTQLGVAHTLINSEDLADFVRWHRDPSSQPSDSFRLARGWRRELYFDMLTQVLDGKTTFAIERHSGDYRLVFKQDNGSSAQ